VEDRRHPEREGALAAKIECDRDGPSERRAMVERRAPGRPGGRRAVDRPTGNAWTTGQLAYHIGMSPGFVLAEIKAREILASQFGREYRIARTEVQRYLLAKGFPLPANWV
jgi:excisionase family DNA binding protein